jgi:hypothetical protein
MHEKLKHDFCEAHDFDAPYREVVATGGIGYGKSFFMELGLIWQLYFLSCLRSPQSHFKMGLGSKISIMVISLTEKQAKKNIFGAVKEMIKFIPYFRENFMFDEKRDTESLLFPNNVEFFLGNSAQSSTIGLNIYSACLDEANFFKVIEKSKRGSGDGTYDEAFVLYDSLLGRQESRFLKEGLKPGLLYVGSSRMYPNDFTEQRINKAKESSSSTTFILDYNLWTVNRGRYSKEEFQVEVGEMSRRSRILTGNETDIIGKVLNIPIDFKSRFETDLDNAIRNLAGVAVYAVQPFIGQPEHINEMFDHSMDRVFSVDQATLSPKAEYRSVERILGKCKHFQNRPRYVGLDLSLGKRDSAGFAMGYVEDVVVIEREFWDDETQTMRKVRERQPKVVLEMLLEIKAEAGFGEIEFGQIRFLIFQLRELGYRIKYITADGYESADIRQIFKRKGIQFDTLSMDKSPAPYETFRTAMYEGRVRSIYHSKIEEELRTLERDMKTGKVDHRVRGSKDLADAAGQVVHNAHINSNFLDDSLLGFSSGIQSDKMENKEFETVEDIAESLNAWVRGVKTAKPSPTPKPKKEIVIK